MGTDSSSLKCEEIKCIITGNSERQMKEGSANGASLSLQELYKGNLEGGLLYWGALKDIKRKSMDMGISLHRGPNGEPGGEVHLLGTSRDRKEGSGNTASLPLWGSARGPWREGSFTGGPGRREKGRLWTWASPSIGAPMGNLEERFIYWGL
jgi:hypothetical protein